LQKYAKVRQQQKTAIAANPNKMIKEVQSGSIIL